MAKIFLLEEKIKPCQQDFETRLYCIVHGLSPITFLLPIVHHLVGILELPEVDLNCSHFPYHVDHFRT